MRVIGTNTSPGTNALTPPAQVMNISVQMADYLWTRVDRWRKHKELAAQSSFCHAGTTVCRMDELIPATSEWALLRWRQRGSSLVNCVASKQNDASENCGLMNTLNYWCSQCQGNNYAWIKSERCGPNFWHVLLFDKSTSRHLIRHRRSNSDRNKHHSANMPMIQLTEILRHMSCTIQRWSGVMVTRKRVEIEGWSIVSVDWSNRTVGEMYISTRQTHWTSCHDNLMLVSCPTSDNEGWNSYIALWVEALPRR